LSTAAAHFDDVIPEIDIWRAAQLMPKHHGDKALEESSTRDDDHNGAAVWRRVVDAVGQLASSGSEEARAGTTQGDRS
jgi:hypothetical protein